VQYNRIEDTASTVSSESVLRSVKRDIWEDLRGEQCPKAKPVSQEFKEAQIVNLYAKAVEAIRSGQNWTAVDCFRRIFAHEAVRVYCISDWSNFDWEAAKEGMLEDGKRKSLSDVAKVLLGSCMAMTELAENAIPFYLQVRIARGCIQTVGRFLETSGSGYSSRLYCSVV